MSILQSRVTELVQSAIQPKREDEVQPLSCINHLHNPYAGVAYAWQLDESVDDFLARLAPATTDVEPDREWIYICNPYISLEKKFSTENQLVHGCQDEAPLSSQAQLGTFMKGGTERLHILRDFIEQNNAAARPEAYANREANDARNGAVRDILALAHMLHVRCGKWMLFTEATEVDRVWKAVAQATANDELGIAAKVACRQNTAPTRTRLICIYTYDFLDKDDIGRVLRQIAELNLGKSSHSIYYKCGRTKAIFYVWATTDCKHHN